MKNNNYQDERILSERREIQSRGYAWLIIILLISIIVQQFFMKAPFAQYAVEFFLLIGCGCYNIIANYNKGIDIWNPTGNSKKQILTSTLISGIFSVILFSILSGTYKINSLVFYFPAFIVFFFMTRLIMISINRRKHASIDSELEEE